jgi:2C-methyl-D-erythritol 2,4-cyclodiphosphate synthase
MRIGFGYDVHRLTVDRRLILAGVNIPFHLGLWGHSDADVIIHAIIDALLGAMAKGDIGTHFPDNDEQYKEINSRILLRKVAGMLHSENFKLANLDVTVCAQEPKLQPYIYEMRSNIAFDLNCDISQISIKATTEEGMGLTGEGKAITASAVALIQRF